MAESLRHRVALAASLGPPAVARGVARGALERRRPRRGPVALMFHGTADPYRDLVLLRNLTPLDCLRAEARFLRRKALPPEVVLEPELPTSGVVLTFDDGYANNLVVAEVLAEHKVPWALFVSTDLVGSGRTIWTVEEALLLLHGEAREVELMGERWDLSDRHARERSFSAMRRRLKALPAADRVREMAQLEAQFPDGEIERLLAQWPELAMMTWPDVAQLASAGVVIGGHGTSHEMQHADQPEDVLRRELTGSRDRIASEVGRPPTLFAYPDGQIDPARSPQLAAAVGYRGAFTTVEATMRPGDDRLALPRLGASSELATLAHDLRWEAA